MFSEQTYEEYYKNLKVTSAEVLFYTKNDLFYTDFNQLLNLYARTTFYLADLLDELSIIAFYLDTRSRQDLITLFQRAKPIIEDQLISVTHTTPIPYNSISKARTTVHNLQPNRLNLDVSHKYILHFLETFLEFVTTYKHFQSSSLAD